MRPTLKSMMLGLFSLITSLAVINANAAPDPKNDPFKTHRTAKALRKASKKAKAKTPIAAAPMATTAAEAAPKPEDAAQANLEALPTEPLDSIAAVVNESIITKSELAQHMHMIEGRMQRENVELPDPFSFKKQVLEHMIVNEVQLQIAKRTGINIDDNMVDEAIQNMAARNQMTVAQMREAMEHDGVEFNGFRENIREQIALSQLQQRDVMGDVQISEQEVNQFIHSPTGLGGMGTEYRLGHILIALSQTPSPEELDAAEKRAQSIIDRLNAGEDFAKVALNESQGDTALQGGDLGYRKLPEMPTLFVKIVPTLAVNQIPHPIRSGSGYHIIKLLDKRQATGGDISHEKTLARHILIPTNATMSDQEALQRLNDLRQKIVQGEDFGKLAKAHSADLASAANGGSLGWISKEMLVPEFSAQMEKLQPNEISEPFKTSFGWHIVQVQDRKVETFDEHAQRNKAKELIRQRKLEEKLQAWSRQIRDESYVKVEDEA